MRVAKQEESDGKAMQGEHKEVKGNDESDEIRSADRVWEIGGNDKRMVCANNQDVEVYEE